MKRTSRLTDDEVNELFSALNESGVVDPEHGKGKDGHRVEVDPLSSADPSGSRTGEAISRTALIVIVAALVLIVGMQIAYGVNRRLNTANLSERVNRENVEHALESGVEWGNGFTQFPEQYTVDEADEKTGVVEVSVTDTSSKNELELLSNSQIQAAALATNALLNDRIDQVVYNVYVLMDESGAYQSDHLFGFIPARGTRRAQLTFIWTKAESESSNYIDWELKIVGMDDETTSKIQEQVNSVSSLIEDGSIDQDAYDEGVLEQNLEHLMHGREIFRGGAAEKAPEDMLDAEE